MKKSLLALLTFLLLGAPLSATYSFKVEVKGQGEPLLLIPGLTCPGEVWAETVALLSDRYECHSITLPGFAGQPPTADFQESFLENVRKELAAYIQEIGKPVTIIGHSLGGFTAMNLAIHNPEGVKKIVVVDSYPSMGAIFFGKNADLAQVADIYEKGRPSMMDMEPQAYEDMQRQTLHAMIIDSAHAERALQWSLASDRETALQAYQELLLADLRPRMAEIDCPGLILQAGLGPNYTDKKWKEINENQYGKNRKIKIARNGESMHFIMFDQPAWMAEQLLDFL